MTGLWFPIQLVFQQDILQLFQQNVLICLQVGLKHRPCQEFQNKFPNLYYVEPMQYNNPDGKWSESIPYMIINLEHERDVYLGKDTIMAVCKRRRQVMCNYLEINEIVQLARCQKGSPHKR